MANRRKVKKAVKAVRKMSPGAIFVLLIFLVLVIGGYYVYKNYIEKDVSVDAKGEISFHFMMLGNEYAGDSIYIKAGENDILIDAGSKAGSVEHIDNYLKDYVTDNTLEYVIVTHADQDHIAGFAASESIFDLYKCENIIDFPLTGKELTTNKGNPTLYANYVENREQEVQTDGAKHYTALECYNNQNGAQRIYDLTDDGNIKMEILYNYFYEHTSSDENNYSVCVQFSHGSERKFLFTGDLEIEGEEKLAEKYDFSQVELFKAGHHGSPTSSNDCLLDEIKPKICVVCCCAGSVEYTDYLPKTFPSRAVLQRLTKHNTKIYVPIMIDIIAIGEKEYEDQIITDYKNAEEYKQLNGNIKVVSNADRDEVYVECSNNDTVLTETAWYKTVCELWKNYD